MNSADQFTRRLLQDSGIGRRQRVLDVGCGAGAVTSMILDLIGDGGQVIGIDRDTQAIELARGQPDLARAEFIQADLGDLPRSLGEFDAIVGRRVLMYQPDAAATLGQLAAILRPGGLLILQEHDSSAMPLAGGALPLHQRVHRLIWETVRSEGADLRMGMNLPHACEQAGLTLQDVRSEATVLSSVSQHPIEAIVRAMLPRMVTAGLVKPDELEIDGLDDRLAQERAAAGAICLWELVFGVVARG